MAVFKFSFLLQELVVFLTLHRYTFAESSCFPPVGIGGIALGRRTLGAEVLIFAARTNIDITLHWLALVSLVALELILIYLCIGFIGWHWWHCIGQEDIGSGRPKDAQPCSNEHFCTTQSSGKPESGKTINTRCYLSWRGGNTPFLPYPLFFLYTVVCEVIR